MFDFSLNLKIHKFSNFETKIILKLFSIVKDVTLPENHKTTLKSLLTSSFIRKQYKRRVDNKYCADKTKDYLVAVFMKF